MGSKHIDPSEFAEIIWTDIDEIFQSLVIKLL